MLCFLLGLDEYLIWEPEKSITRKCDCAAPNEEASFLNVISASKKAQKVWQKTNLKDRIQRFKVVAASLTEK